FSWMAGPFVSASSVDGLLVENNVIQGGDYPISASGKNIRVLRNTVVDATMRSTNFWGVSNVVVEGNIFYRPCIHDKVNTALLFTDVRGPVRSDNNVYWSPVSKHPVGGTIRDPAAKVLKQSKTLEEWRQLSGMDLHSIAADPLFVDYEKGDLRLKEGSPAKGKGASF
ncbi:MAG: right-handed parallel beta-helix repeat-containing protein, partial [Lentisphaeria bacterium]|nr:right-handed parallel beta-helix repeat-containing protein [Lentisphaeria bacterium]